MEVGTCQSASGEHMGVKRHHGEGLPGLAGRGGFICGEFAPEFCGVGSSFPSLVLVSMSVLDWNSPEGQARASPSWCLLYSSDSQGTWFTKRGAVPSATTYSPLGGMT